MPVGGGPAGTPFPSATALLTVFSTLTFVGAGSQTTDNLQADNLPQLSAWFLQTAGAGAVTIQIEFANGVGTVQGEPTWQPLIAAFNLVLNTPSLSNPKLGTRRFRATITSTGAATVLYRMSASI